MKLLIKLLVVLVGIGAVAWGGALISLGLVGASAPAKNVQARRVGGELDEANSGKYTYSISYDFVTRDGKVASGHCQVVGSSSSVEKPTRIRFFEAYPSFNAPEEECGVRVYPIALLGIGVILLIVTGRRRKEAEDAQRRSPGASAAASLHESGEDAAVSIVDQEEWLRKYRSKSRTHARFFFAGIVVVIGGVIRFGMEEFSQEWALATGFAAAVMWVLAFFSRRTAASSWDGTVTSKKVVTRRDTRNEQMYTTRTSHVVHMRTDSGKKKKLHVGERLFDAYREGARVHKLAGLSFPLMDGVDAASAFCPVCGNLIHGASEQCPSCRAPLFYRAG